MKAIMVMFDSLNRDFLPNYGCEWTKMPNFKRLSERTITFDNFYGASMPCMPARRELHTGRYNFLHRSWTPMEPFDDSVVERLKKAGIYTHIATDHFHYWEDGGSCYLTKFDSFDMIRGQQGDPWMGQVERPYFPDTLSNRKNGENWRHDWINRGFLTSEEKMPQRNTFEVGLDFINRNKDQDNWYLQIEVFDPHEPFYSQQEYKDLYPHDYHGKQIDWPDYGKNELTVEETEHVRLEYAALLSMCDKYLGKVLDKMDECDMWKDTMLIVNTDHGFMLGEKEWMGKNVQPFYNEIVHTPFFIYDPRNPIQGERREALAQTIDIVPTIAEYFEIEGPKYMDGVALTPVIKNDSKIREAGLFGIHGGHVNVTDGRYVYMHAPNNVGNKPLYEYTLMPCHMNAMFKTEELKDMELVNVFNFTQDCKVMKIPTKVIFNTYWHGSKLFDLHTDPQQQNPIQSTQIQIKMIEHMRSLMVKNEAPIEQFERLGIDKEGKIDEELINQFKEIAYEPIKDERLNLTERAEKAVVIYLSMIPEVQQIEFLDLVVQCCKKVNSTLGEEKVIECVKQLAPPQFKEMIGRMIKNYL